MAGKKKRPSRPSGPEQTQIHKATRQRRHKLWGTAKRKAKSKLTFRLMLIDPKCTGKAIDLDEWRKQNQIKPENPKYLAKDNVLSTGKFHLTGLMEHPIKYGNKGK